MKKLVSIVAMIMITSIAFLLGGCGDPYKNVNIEFSSDTVDIVLGVSENDTTSIIATVSGFGSGASDVIMFSPLVNNVVVTSVTSLGNGKYRAFIKALQPGMATIKTTTVEGNKSKLFTVNVVQPIENFSVQTDLVPFILKNANEPATPLTLNGESLFAFLPTNTTQKQITFSLKNETEGASIENGVLSLDASFCEEFVSIVATSFSKPDLVCEFDIKVIEPIDSSDVEVNGTPMSESTKNVLVANNTNHSMVSLLVKVNKTKQVFATLSSPTTQVGNESNFSITPNILEYSEENYNVFSWNVWIKTLGTHQLTLTLSYGGFSYSVEFTNQSLVVEVVNEPTDVLFDDVSLNDVYIYTIYNEYAPLLLGTMFNVTVAPNNVLPVNALIVLSQDNKADGSLFDGLEIYLENGEMLLVGDEIASGTKIYVRGQNGFFGQQSLKLICKSIFENTDPITRMVLFDICEGVTDMSNVEGDDGNKLLEIVSENQEPTFLTFMVYPTISKVDGFGISLSNANVVVDSEFVLGDIVTTWRKVSLGVTPKAEGYTTLIIYSGNGYFVKFELEIVYRISEVGFRIATHEENNDVRVRNTKTYLTSGLTTLDSAIVSSSSTGISLTLVKNPVKAYATTEYSYCDYILDESGDWVMPSDVTFASASSYISIGSSKILPTNINGGKTLVKAFVKTTIVDSNGNSITAYISPNGTFFTKQNDSYLSLDAGQLADDSNPAWFLFTIETFVPISKITINKTTATLSTLSSVGYYKKEKSEVNLSVVVFPSNATHANDITWSCNNYDVSFYSLTIDSSKTKATFIALKIGSVSTKPVETAKVTVSVSELSDRVFMQYCDISWSDEKMVEEVALHNTDTLNGIYLENLPNQTNSFTILATAYPTTSYNTNLRYSFLPDAMTVSNFLSVDEETGVVTINQNGSGKGYIIVAPEDRFQDLFGVIYAKANMTTDECIKKIPIIVVDGRNEEFALRIYDSYKFETIRSLPSLFYKICANITLTNFEPIQKFTGSLDGSFIVNVGFDNSGLAITEERTYSLTLAYSTAPTISPTDSGYYGLLFHEVGAYTYEELSEQIFQVEIKNLYIKVNFNFSSLDFTNYSVGILAGFNVGNISNVKIIDYSDTNKSIFACNGATVVGGFVGENAGKIINSSSNLILSSNSSIGGFVGTNKVFQSIITVPGASQSITMTFAGTLNNVRNMGRVTGNGIVGGIVALNSSTIENAYFETVESGESSLEASSIVGLSESSAVGGIVGKMNGGTISLSYYTSYKFGRVIGENNFYGDIYALSGDVGGIVGQLINGNIDQCFTNGSLNADSYAGGIAGIIENGVSRISNTYSLGVYKGNAGQGALVGAIVDLNQTLYEFKQSTDVNPPNPNKEYLTYNEIENFYNVFKPLASFVDGVTYYEPFITEDTVLSSEKTYLIFIDPYYYPIGFSFETSYSVAKNLEDTYLTTCGNDGALTNFQGIYIGVDAIKTFTEWKEVTPAWDFSTTETASDKTWNYGLFIASQNYPYLSDAVAPVAPTEINDLVFEAGGTNFVPFKKDSEINNAIVLFYYQPLTTQNLTSKIVSEIANLNTVSLNWAISEGKIKLGSLLTFGVLPTNATKLFDHYVITSSNTNAVRVINNSSLQAFGIGNATISIVSKLNSSISISFDVEVAYPQGIFKLVLGSNVESGTSIKNGDIIKIKRTYSQNISSTLVASKVIDNSLVYFKTETVAVSFKDSLGNTYDSTVPISSLTRNSNLSVTNKILGTHSITANNSSENGYFTVKASLSIVRNASLALSENAVESITSLMTKTFYVKVWTGAESITTSQSTIEIEPIVTPVFEFFVTSDAEEIIDGDILGYDINGDPIYATADNSTLYAEIDQSHQKPVIFGTPLITRVSEYYEKTSSFIQSNDTDYLASKEYYFLPIKTTDDFFVSEKLYFEQNAFSAVSTAQTEFRDGLYTKDNNGNYILETIENFNSSKSYYEILYASIEPTSDSAMVAGKVYYEVPVLVTETNAESTYLECVFEVTSDLTRDINKTYYKKVRNYFTITTDAFLTKDLGNGFVRETYSIELVYLSDWHKSLITERMSYQIKIFSKTSSSTNIYGITTIIVKPQSLYTVSARNYCSTQESASSMAENGEYDFSIEPSNTIYPGLSGLLAVELFPFYSSWDSLSLTYYQEEGKAVSFEPLVKLDNDNYATNQNAVYQFIDNGLLVQKESIIEEEIDSNRNGSEEIGMFYARLLIGTNITSDTTFYITIKVYFNGEEISGGGKTLKLIAQYLPGATFEIDGKTESDQLLPRGQDYSLDVSLIGVDRMDDVQVLGYGNIPSGSLASLYKVEIEKLSSTILKDSDTGEMIGTKVSHRMTIGILCEQVKNENNEITDDGYITLSVRTSRIINGAEEQKDSTIRIRVVDYIIESIKLANKTSIEGSDEENVFVSDVNVERQLAFKYSFKGVDELGYTTNYHYQSIEQTVARDTEKNAIKELEELRNNLSKVSLKNSLYIVDGNNEYGLVVDGAVNSLVSSKFDVNEADIDSTGTYASFIITGINYSTTNMRYKLEVAVRGGSSVVYTYDFKIKIDIYTSEDYPSLIYTYEDLVRAVEGIEDNEAEDYILMADINLVDFTPFENTSKISSLDGNNNVITINSFAVPNSGTTEYQSLKFSLFNTISSNTILKNLIVDIGNLEPINLDGLNLASVIYAPLAVTNTGIVTNCHVQNLSDNLFSVSGKGNIQIDNASTSNDSIIYMCGFVKTNSETGSITNSSFGGSGKQAAPTPVLTKTPISIVGKGNIAGFVCENNGRIVSCSALNFTIVNSSVSSQNVASAGFVITNTAVGVVMTSQAKDCDAYDYEKTKSKLGISSMGIRSGFVYSNSGKISDCASSFNFTDSLSTIGGYTAGFVYKNLATATISTSFAETILNTSLLGQTEFSGIDERAKSLNDGTISLSYYYSRTYSGSTINSENSFKTGALAVPNTMDIVNFVGFNIESSGSNNYGTWRVVNKDIELIDPNTDTVSIRVLKTDSTDESKYILPFHTSTKYGTSTNPILIKSADEFNRFISNPTSSEMKQFFSSYGTTYINGGTFRLVRDIDLSELSSEGSGNVKLGTVRLSLVGGSIQGNGFVIKNLDVSSSGLPTTNRTSIGLFKSLEQHASIKNLTIEVLNVSGNDFERVGAVAGIIKDSYLTNVEIKKSTDSSKVIGKNIVGGVAGVVVGASLLKNVKAEIIVEASHSSATVPLFISNNISVANLSIAGAVVGVNSSTVPTNLTNNFEQIVVQGNFSVQAMIAGGVCGFVGNTVSVKDVLVTINSGSTFVQRITSTNSKGYAGGFAGHSSTILNHVRIEHESKIQAKIEDTISTYYAQTNSSYDRGGNEKIFEYSKGYIGGLVGLMDSGRIINSYSKISVVSPIALYAGGLVGKASMGTITSTLEKEYEISDAYFFGDVQALNAAGGLIGYNSTTGLRLNALFVASYLRMKQTYPNYGRIFGACGLNASVVIANPDNVVSINTIPTGVSGQTVKLSPIVENEATYDFASLLPPETEYYNVSQIYTSFNVLVWTRSSTSLFPRLTFGLPSDNIKKITNTNEILVNINENSKGTIYILEPENDGTTIAWPEGYQPTKFSGTIRSVEGKTVTLTNVSKTMFKSVYDSKFVNFNIAIKKDDNNSIISIADAVLAKKTERCIFSNIEIKGNVDTLGNITSKIVQTAGDSVGLGVLAQSAFVKNEVEDLTIENFIIDAPTTSITGKEVGIGGVFGVASGTAVFSNGLKINKISISNNVNIDTPSTYKCGLVVGDASLCSLTIDETSGSIVSGAIILNNLGCSFDASTGKKGVVSIGGIVGECSELIQNNIKVSANIYADVIGSSAIVSVGGFAGRVTTKADLNNSTFTSITNSINKIQLDVTDTQISSLGGAIGRVEGELAVSNANCEESVVLTNTTTEAKNMVNVGGIVGYINSSSKKGADKAVTRSSFTGVIFVQAEKAKIGGILGSDASTNLAKTVIDYCRVGNGNVIESPVYNSEVTQSPVNNPFYYSGTIVISKHGEGSSEISAGGIAGAFEKIGDNGIGSCAENNLAFGDIYVDNDKVASTLCLGGIVGKASKNYVYGNISFTSLKCNVKYDGYTLGAIVGYKSYTWKSVANKGLNYFSHQMSLSTEDGTNASTINKNLYLKNVGTNETTLFDELNNYVANYSKNIDGFNYATDSKCLFGSKLKPITASTYSNLKNATSNVNDYLTVKILTSNETGNSSTIDVNNGMLIGDGHQLTTTVANIVGENKGYISGFGVVGYNLQTNTNVTGDYGNANGLLAGVNEGIILGCYTNGSLIAIDGFDGDVGGLVGTNVGRIKDSFSLANLHLSNTTANRSHGGLVGYGASTSFIETSYSTGVIDCQSGNNSSFIGASASNSTINSCWTSSVVMNASGTIVPTSFPSTATLNKCYYDSDAIGIVTKIDNVTALTYAKMKTDLATKNYVSNNFAIGTTEYNHFYPTLTDGIYATTPYLKTSRNIENIFKIDELNAMSSGTETKTNKYFLRQNIELSSWGLSNIKNITYINLQGLNKNLNKLKVSIKSSSKLSGGVFGVVQNSTIRNLVVKSCEIQMLPINIIDMYARFVGAIAGTAVNSNFIGCVSQENILKADYIGGLVGKCLSENSSFINCENNSELSGGYACGGIVGEIIITCNFESCVNNSNLTNNSSIGGIVGAAYNDSNESILVNCINNGTITSTSMLTVNGAGGMIGQVFSTDITINNCTNNKTISSKLVVGGMVGYSNYSINFVGTCKNNGTLAITQKIVLTETKTSSEHLDMVLVIPATVWYTVTNSYTRTYNYKFYLGEKIGNLNSIPGGELSLNGYSVSIISESVDTDFNALKESYYQYTSSDNSDTSTAYILQYYVAFVRWNKTRTIINYQYENT